MDKKASVILPGTVDRIIKPPARGEHERVQIGVEGADHIYKDIRIENTLTDDLGQKVRLEPGAKVQVTIASEPDRPTSEARQGERNMAAARDKTTTNIGSGATTTSDHVIDRTAPAGSKNSLGAQSVRDGRPATDDSTVEAIDEEGPDITAR
jgi:hypothetical protein